MINREQIESVWQIRQQLRKMTANFFYWLERRFDTSAEICFDFGQKFDDSAKCLLCGELEKNHHRGSGACPRDVIKEADRMSDEDFQKFKDALGI